MSNPLGPTGDHLREVVQAQCDRAADAVALLAAGLRPLSYRQLAEQIDSVGYALRDLGIQCSDRVAVVVPNGPDMAAAFLGVAAYATCAPLNPMYGSDEFDFYLTDLDAKAVIVPVGADSAVRDAAERLGLALIDLVPSMNQRAGDFQLGNASAEGTMPLGRGGSDDVALVLHTSGTTSRPKLVPLSHRNLGSSARNIVKVLGLSPQDRCLNVMPLFHIHGLVGVLCSSICAGGSVICCPGYEDEGFAEWMDDLHPTWYSAVPTIHQSVLALARRKPAVAQGGHLRLIRSSSSSLPPTVMAELEETFRVPVIESYGMTEAAHQMASNPLPPAERKPGSVGLPAGPQMACMDDDGNLLPTGETGEIVIRGASVTAGYANNLEANGAAFTDGWFRTGDLGYFDEDGYLFLSGRKKEMINRGGENISPREIDEVLLEHADVAQAVAFAVPHPSLGEDVAAAVVLQGQSTVTENTLRRFAYSRLAAFKVPSRIIFLAEIPKGPTGKLQRIGLHEKLADSLRHEYVAPRTSLGADIAAIFADILEMERVGAADNFFALGGDSLKATRVIARISSNYQIELSVVAVFLNPTPEELECEVTRRLSDEPGVMEELLDAIERMSDEDVRGAKLSEG